MIPRRRQAPYFASDDFGAASARSRDVSGVCSLISPTGWPLIAKGSCPARTARRSRHQPLPQDMRGSRGRHDSAGRGFRTHLGQKAAKSGRTLIVELFAKNVIPESRGAR